MTRDDIEDLCAGDSIIGIAPDDECQVVAVERRGKQRIAHVRYSATTIMRVPLRANGPEIRGARL